MSSFAAVKHLKSRRWLSAAKKKIKRFLEFAFYATFDSLVLALIKPKPDPKRVALVHLGLLGDCFLWLPFAQALVAHFTQQGREIVIVADAAFRDLLASALPNCTLMLESRGNLLHRPFRRAQFLRQLRQLGIAETLHATWPRDAIWQDAVVCALGAPAVGFDSTYPDRSFLDRAYYGRLYERLLPAPRIQTHVQTALRHFLRAIGIAEEQLQPLSCNTFPQRLIEQPYWVLAPGASRAYRRWPVERFVAISRYVASRRPSWRAVIVGSAAEVGLAERIASALGDQALNLAGKTTLIELISLIGDAFLVIGNDSAAGHIAACLGVPSVVVVGGGHWRRCFPYDPKTAIVRRLPVAVGHAMPCYHCGWSCTFAVSEQVPYPCVAAIETKVVQDAVECVLNDMETCGLT